jgi:hypothetical protein
MTEIKEWQMEPLDKWWPYRLERDRRILHGHNKRTEMTNKEKISVLSLGWGVQSFTLAAMAALDEIEKPDLVVFADTTHENASAYKLAEDFTSWLGERGVTVETVQAKSTQVESDKNELRIPAFTKNIKTGEISQIGRQCTGIWKISPVRKLVSAKLKEHGLKKTPDVAEMWLGITTDEWQRMRDADVKWVKNRFPLIERRMSRMDCITWLESKDLPVPDKSGCVFCPYMRTSYWEKSKRNQQSGDWQYAVEVDKSIRQAKRIQGYELFIHRKGLPLEDAVKIVEDFGASQSTFDECDSGFCWS